VGRWICGLRRLLSVLRGCAVEDWGGGRVLRVVTWGGFWVVEKLWLVLRRSWLESFVNW